MFHLPFTGRVEQSLLSRVNTLYSGIFPGRQVGCSLRNKHLCIWVTYQHLWLFDSELWVLYQPKHGLPFHSIQTQRHSQFGYSYKPFLLRLFGKLKILIHEMKQFFHTINLDFSSFLVLPSPTSTAFLVTRGLTDTLCCPCIILSFGGFKASGLSSHWPKSILT